jgi:hypothetical protein
VGEWIGLALWLLMVAGLPPGLLLGDGAERLWPRPWQSATLFNPARRSVSNWRQESARWLDADPLRRARFVFEEGDDLPRCVRLNNYWCIKRAGWAGEISADREDHVAFSSAREGATVAALLLRRYYTEFDRKSALDIVSRWAPAQCGLSPLVAAGGKGAAKGQAVRATRRAAAGTLRGRWLSRHRPGFTGPKFAGRGGVRVSRVKTAPLPMMRAPTISSGGGELAPAALASIKLTALDLSAPAPGAKPGRVPLASCTGERQRIDNYAAKLAAGLAVKPTDDLHLFDEAGDPTPALAIALLNMAGVEIGPFRATQALVEDAVDDLREIVALRKQMAEEAKAAKDKAAKDKAAVFSVQPAPPPTPASPPTPAPH